MFIFHPKPVKEKLVLVNCINFQGWKNTGSYPTDILHILVQVPAEDSCSKIMTFLLLPSLVLVLRLNFEFCPFVFIFQMNNSAGLSSLHFNWNVNKQPCYSEDNNISIYLEK